MENQVEKTKTGTLFLRTLYRDFIISVDEKYYFVKSVGNVRFKLSRIAGR